MSAFCSIKFVALPLVLAALAACGGGGGSSSAAENPGSVTVPVTVPAASSPSGTPGSSQGSSSDGGVIVNVDPIVDTPESFDFTVQPSQIGHVFAAWNPTNDQVMAAGAQVLFFGYAPTCSFELQGASTQRANMTWYPDNTAGNCDHSNGIEQGPSVVNVQTGGSTPNVSMATGTNAGAGFLQPFTNAGQLGTGGANKYLLGSFFHMRQAWGYDGSGLHTFATGGARIVSTQNVTQAEVEGPNASEGYNQVQQEMLVTFLNTTCINGGFSSTHPCQLQYDLMMHVARTGVSDWTTQSWYQNLSVWSDPGQGGIPVVSGRIADQGVEQADGASGVSLWTSQGNSTQHGTFSAVNFDIRISMQQLMNAITVMVAQIHSESVNNVTTDQMVASWGADWNNPAAWVLLSAGVGQEVFNPYSDRTTQIAGSFSRLYVGPQQ